MRSIELIELGINEIVRECRIIDDVMMETTHAASLQNVLKKSENEAILNRIAERHQSVLREVHEKVRDLLFEKMHEAEYEWDDEKKELKRIEEEYDGEDYGIDSLFHAQRILEKTLGKVDGYQTDDGILSHKCAISAVKKLYEKKPAKWSEEDENFFANICSMIDADRNFTESAKRRCKDRLKSLKDRVQPQNRWKPSDEQMDNLSRAFNGATYHVSLL